MSFEIVLRIQAQIDLDETFVWYEEQKTGLGFAFLEEFEVSIYKIARNPFHASYIANEARSASLKRFPYEIIYRVDDTKKQVRIIPIIHPRKDPEWFKQRLRE